MYGDPVATGPDLVVHDVTHSGHQVITGDPARMSAAVVEAVFLLIGIFLHDMDQGLARDGPKVCTAATHQKMVLYNGDRFARFGKVDRSAFTARRRCGHMMRIVS